MTAILEDALEIKVDKWGTLNTAASPNKLPEGHSPNHQNVWTDEKPGSVVTAHGYSKLGALPSNLPVTALINFFKTSDGTSRVVCSDGQNIYQTTDYVIYTTIKTGLSPYFQLRGKVIRNKLWLTNGTDAVMTWDGATLVTLDGTAGTPNVPKGKFIEYHDERIWLYGINGDLSALRFSALTNSSGTEIEPDNAVAWPTDNEIQVSEGDADVGTGIWLYRGYLYCSKQYSVWRIVGYDEYTYTRVKTRASTGTRFQESVQIKDNLVHFIGVDGFYVFDGEEAKRVSDIIDPASPDTGVFAFRNLQQVLLNNQFWNVSKTTDFVAGTVPVNLSTSNDELKLVPADDSQTDFASGTLTNTTATDNPGNLQLALVTSGTPGSQITPSGALLDATPNFGLSKIGQNSYLIDGNQTNPAGWQYTNNQLNTLIWEIDLPSAMAVGRIIIRDMTTSQAPSSMFISVQAVEVNTGSSWVGVGNTSVASGSPTSATTFTIDFSTQVATAVRLRIIAADVRITVTEIEVYRAGYQPTGTFISKSLDYGSVPSTFGTLAATIATNGETYQFYTQSSSDGSTWDAAVNVANGAAIGSALKRYLRWGVTLNSSTGINTPVIDKVFVGGTYISEIHNTGGNIFQWQAFQISLDKAGETISAYYRASTTPAGVSIASWIAIANGAIPNTIVANQYIQIRLEFSTIDSTHQPLVESFTVNWTLSSGTGTNTNQNVASIIILNRYWLSAATLGATANDIVIVLGKSTFGSPWHKKDFAFLSYCRFQDYYIAGSSTNGSIYRLETGFSKNGSTMDAFYETADFGKDNFQIKGRELQVTCDRSGPYSLSVGWSSDGGLTYTEKSVDLTRDSGESLSFVKRFNINFMLDIVRFRVRINAADQPFSVDEIRSYYRLTPQRGSLSS